ncbi:hypothetical protein C0Q44_27125 [Paenibacillus sp. PCH8]|uniref:hypothetical protein n=1 Tax=Paenibacillus sp. PCH8 TaxID=2066524 RepID=UPI000CF85C05|nr:hypothetical protein [Paenibacillus sp. PCH8]PQP80457.1 hypothetical protein C0Q44_27125 [Paenibacillus sp. PCH8]
MALGRKTTSWKDDLKAIPSLQNVIGISTNSLNSYGFNQEEAILKWLPAIRGGSSISVLSNSLKNVKTFVTGSYYNVALTSEGGVWTWGSNTQGQLGLGDSDKRSEPTLVPYLEDIIEIAGGSSSNSVYALKKDGSVWGRGNQSYQLGKSGENSLIPTPTFFSNKN